MVDRKMLRMRTGSAGTYEELMTERYRNRKS